MARREARVWTAAAVWMLAVLGVHGGRYPPLACFIQCCNFSPQCDGATTMSCHCPNTTTIRLRSGDIPTTVEYIEISSAQTVKIGTRALYDLHSLQDMTVRDVRSLEVLTDGLALPDAASLKTLRLDRLRSVHLREDALSGRWPQSAELTIHHIGKLHMEQRALHFEADRQGPQVLLEHVSDLQAKSNAFRAAMSQLSLVNVSMSSCQPGTFRGRVKRLSLLGCKLQSVESGCIQPEDRWESVSINTCDIGDVREGALTGNVDTLLLQACNVTRLHPSAVKMSLQRLELQRMHVQDMQERALDVSVCGSLAVMESRVNHLRRHALAGVRLADCRRQDLRPFTIHLLHVGVAERGSLAVHESLPASAVNWDSITFDTECSCGMRGDISRLVAGDEAEAMSDTQRELTATVWDRSFCSDEGNPVRLTDAAVRCPDWEGPDGKGASGGGGGETSLDQNIVFYGVIGGVSVLVLALVGVLVTKRRCVGRALGCGGSGSGGSGGGGEKSSVCDTLQSRRTAGTTANSTLSSRTAGTTANSTLSSVVGASSLDAQIRYEKGLPDLVTAAPGVDLSPPHPGSYSGSYRGSHAEPRTEAAHEHIYAEIGPMPAVTDYADPRDSLAMQQGGEAAPERGQYAEITPLVGSPQPPAVAPPPPPPSPPLTENGLYTRIDHVRYPITHL